MRSCGNFTVTPLRRCACLRLTVRYASDETSAFGRLADITLGTGDSPFSSKGKPKHGLLWTRDRRRSWFSAKEIN
jgi:hypothetical protein